MSNPPSVRMVTSDPGSIDHHHTSIPNSPLSEVLSEQPVHSPMSLVGTEPRRRCSVTNVTLGSEPEGSGGGGLVAFGPAPESAAVKVDEVGSGDGGKIVSSDQQESVVYILLIHHAKNNMHSLCCDYLPTPMLYPGYVRKCRCSDMKCPNSSSDYRSRI